MLQKKTPYQKEWKKYVKKENKYLEKQQKSTGFEKERIWT